MTVLHTTDDERVNALEVRLIQICKSSRIPLRGLDQQPFLVHLLYKRVRIGKSHARLFTIRGDVGNGCHADALELRLTNDVALYQNAMIFQYLGIESAPQISEVRAPI